MSTRFVFMGLEDPDLERSATLRLSRLMDGAPYDSSAAALLKKAENGFWASIDIYSTHGPFAARVTATTAAEAINRAISKISECLENWRTKRFSQRNAAPRTTPVFPDVGVA